MHLRNSSRESKPCIHFKVNNRINCQLVLEDIEFQKYRHYGYNLCISVNAQIILLSLVSFLFKYFQI